MIFLSKNRDLNHSCCSLTLSDMANKQYWTQAHDALFEVVPVFISFIHWLWVWESTWHTVLSRDGKFLPSVV